MYILKRIQQTISRFSVAIIVVSLGFMAVSSIFFLPMLTSVVHPESAANVKQLEILIIELNAELNIAKDLNNRIETGNFSNADKKSIRKILTGSNRMDDFLKGSVFRSKRCECFSKINRFYFETKK